MRMIRRMRVRLARLHRRWNPVALGQSRTGFVLAALLIAGWQLSEPAKAEATEQGYSYNDYFRVDWEYDLTIGRGAITLQPWRYGIWGGPYIMDHGRFTTAGLPFTVIGDYDGYFDIYGPPIEVGVEEGRTLYEYDFNDPVGFGWHGSYENITLDLQFPSEGVELRETEFRYEAFSLSCAGGPIDRLAPDSLPFVTIQTIPEPGSALALGAAAAAAAAAGRRREGEE